MIPVYPTISVASHFYDRRLMESERSFELLLVEEQVDLLKDFDQVM